MHQQSAFPLPHCPLHNQNPEFLEGHHSPAPVVVVVVVVRGGGGVGGDDDDGLGDTGMGVRVGGNNSNNVF